MTNKEIYVSYNTAIKLLNSAEQNLSVGLKDGVIMAIITKHDNLVNYSGSWQKLKEILLDYHFTYDYLSNIERIEIRKNLSAQCYKQVIVQF